MNATAHPEIFEDVINDDLLFNVDFRRNRITTEFKGKYMFTDFNNDITIGQYYEYKKRMVKDLTGQNYQ